MIESALVAVGATVDKDVSAQTRRKLLEKSENNTKLVKFNAFEESQEEHPALAKLVEANIVSADKLDLLKHGYNSFAEAAGVDVKAGGKLKFTRDEPGNRGRPGVVPHFFSAAYGIPPKSTDHIERRLSWHAFDATTPLHPGLVETLEDDATVLLTSIAGLAGKTLPSSDRLDVAYALLNNPGHHATKDHYGGYCFLNWAAFASKLLASEYELESFNIIIHFRL